MLTEARVILPGVQAMLGFQLMVVMTDAFERLPVVYRDLHLVGLALTGVSTALLLAPAAIHRLRLTATMTGTLTPSEPGWSLQHSPACNRDGPRDQRWYLEADRARL